MDEGTVVFMKKIPEVPIRYYLVRVYQTLLKCQKVNQSISIIVNGAEQIGQYSLLITKVIEFLR